MSNRPPLDEMVNGQGGLRPHWRPIMDALGALGRETVLERAEQMNRSLSEAGVNGLLPGSQAASWQCDPLPLPLAADEFRTLEEGLAQRAALLDAVIDDVYGRQSLLADGALPPELVWANRGFERACTSLPSGQSGRARRLRFYAADLIRGPDQAWRVLADRTGSANGAAFALENRRMLARAIPEFFRPGEIAPLRPFFEVWQDSLRSMPELKTETPGIALLTSGHHDRSWFEHVLLARELSCALVEPGDLTVRDGVLYLKTLRGPRRIDVLICKQDPRGLDPLEMSAGNTSGIPGLLDAARAGNVRIVNDPGSVVAEAPALSGFLPALAPRLLGEPLLLTAVPKLWLGDPRARSLVLGDMSRWTIRPALESGGAGERGAAMSESDRAALAARISTVPWRFVAQADLTPSMAPCLTEGGLSPKPIVLRVFMIFDGLRWRAMQGGLARALDEGEDPSRRLPSAGMAKDVWVLAEEGIGALGVTLPPPPPLAIRRSSGELPSRVADNFFWFGRYLERLDHAARLQRALLTRMARAGLSARDEAELRLLVACLLRAELIDPEHAVGTSVVSLSAALLRGPGGNDGTADDGSALLGQIGRIAYMAETLRDRLSVDMHAAMSAALRRLDRDLRALRPGLRQSGLERLGGILARVLNFVATMSGLAAENMVRGGGLLFLDLGRRIERGHAIAGDLAELLSPPAGGVVQRGRMEDGLRLALELCDSSITYRSRYLSVIQPAPALDLLLADEGNPRGLQFQLRRARQLLHEIADAADPLSESAGQLASQADALVAEVAASRDQIEAAARMVDRLAVLESGIADLSVSVRQKYFALLPQLHSLGVDDATVPLRGAAE